MGTPDVNSLTTGQIYAGFAPQTASGDYLVLTKVSGNPINTLGGTNQNGDRMARIQVDCISQNVAGATNYAKAYARVKALSEAVRESLRNWRDSGAKVTSCTLENEIDDTEPPEDGTSVGTQRVILDFIVWYQ